MSKRGFWEVKRKGVTLIELIVAIMISTMVFAMAYTTINFVTKFFHQQSGKVFARDDVRQVLNQITKDIEASKDTGEASGKLVFIQQNNQAISYYYDETKKAVVRAVAADISSEAVESVFIDSVTNSFSILKSSVNPNAFDINLETLNLKKYWGNKETETYNITVSRRFGEPTYLPIPLRLLNDSLPNGKVNQEYSWPLSAEGGKEPYTFTCTNLPGGLKLIGNVISGIPTAAGTFTFTVTVQDSSNPSQTDSKQFIVNILPADSVNTGDPFIDLNNDGVFNGSDYYINLKPLSGTELSGSKYDQKKSYGFIYNGPGYLVIPSSPTIPSQYDLYLYAENGINIKSSINTKNSGHDIILESNGPIILDNVTLSAKQIIVDSTISISKNLTNFICKTLRLVVNGKNINP